MSLKMTRLRAHEVIISVFDVVLNFFAIHVYVLRHEDSC